LLRGGLGRDICRQNRIYGYVLVFDVFLVLEFFLWKYDDQLAHMSGRGAVELGEASSAHAAFF
jgi:hypothetical protein